MTDARIQEIMRRARRGDFGSLNRDELLALAREWGVRMAELEAQRDEAVTLLHHVICDEWDVNADAPSWYVAEAWLLKHGLQVPEVVFIQSPDKPREPQTEQPDQ